MRTIHKSTGIALAALWAVAPAAAKPRSELKSQDFLGKPVGARFVGLGLSGVALPGSPQSPVVNPAGLNDLSAPAFSMDFQVANQSSLAEDVLLSASSLRGKKLTYLGFAGPGRAVFYRPLADFDDTVVTDPARPEYNYTQNSVKIDQFGITAAQNAEKGYDVGLGISYISGRRGYATAKDGAPPVLTLATGNGFAVDWGFRDRQGSWAYGLAIRNLPGILYWDQYRSDQLPTLAQAGLVFQPAPAFAFLTDYEKRFYVGDPSDPDIWHFGVEIAPTAWLVLRGGADSENLNDRNKTAHAFGLSVGSPRGQTLDVAARSLMIEDTRVYQYYLTLMLPLPGGEKQQAEPRRRTGRRR